MAEDTQTKRAFDCVHESMVTTHASTPVYRSGQCINAQAASIRRVVQNWACPCNHPRSRGRSHRGRSCLPRHFHHRLAPAVRPQPAGIICSKQAPYHILSSASPPPPPTPTPDNQRPTKSMSKLPHPDTETNSIDKWIGQDTPVDPI